MARAPRRTGRGRTVAGRSRHPDWRLAKDVLHEVLSRTAEDPAGVEVGYAKKLDEGRYYRVFRATCTAPGARLPGALEDGAERGEEAVLVARLPLPDGPEDQPERARREARLLDRLAGLDPGVRLPRMVGTVDVPEGVALVQSFVEGMALDLRADRGRFGEPWEFVARAAAACHGMDTGRIRDVVPGHDDCREHARARLEVLSVLDLPEAGEALAWAEEHLPPPEPPVLVHGDLLGQNLLVDGLLLDPDAEPEDHELGVVDWDGAVVGDPAYDLSIVTRGVRRPFQTAGGLQKLVGAYARRSGHRLERNRVRLYELPLAAGFYRQAVESHGEGSPHAEDVRRRFRSVVRRTCG